MPAWNIFLGRKRILRGSVVTRPFRWNLGDMTGFFFVLMSFVFVCFFTVLYAAFMFLLSFLSRLGHGPPVSTLFYILMRGRKLFLFFSPFFLKTKRKGKMIMNLLIAGIRTSKFRDDETLFNAKERMRMNQKEWVERKRKNQLGGLKADCSATFWRGQKKKINFVSYKL